MKLIEDVANKSSKHEIKNKWFADNGIEVKRFPLPVADYILVNDKVQDVIERKEKRGTDVKKMDFLGTYSVAVDTKENIQEIIGNICGKSHDRFRDECILGMNNGIKLYILIENTDGVSCIEDLFHWRNPRREIYTRDWNNPIGYTRTGAIRYGRKLKYPKATKGETLAKAIISMEKKYGVSFLFCSPDEAGAKVIELLLGGDGDEA